jgi:protein TonB
MASPMISSTDRLSLTLFLAAVVHALLILGVGFTSPTPKPAQSPPLIEVTLAEKAVAETPQDYDYLAQANQDGGGESRQKQRPKKAAAAAAAAHEGRAPTQTTPAAATPARGAREVAATRSAQPRAAPQAESAADRRPPIAAELISDNPQSAHAIARQRETESVLAKYPSKRRIDARTKAHAAAEYMHRWVEKVEQVGNLNYPEEARRRGLSGSLILEVTLRPDGSLTRVRVLDSSRLPVLDQAAMRIVHIAAPFAPVPAEVLAGNDLLVLTRTWEFVDNQGILTGD